MKTANKERKMSISEREVKASSSECQSFGILFMRKNKTSASVHGTRIARAHGESNCRAVGQSVCLAT